MIDSTQSGSDNDVTSKHPSTEVEADKIKDTQAEQSAKIAHTTQAEHMNNSGQSTPYAQGSAQAELDHIVDINDMVVENSLEVIFDKMGYTKNTDFRKHAIRLIADWHNKKIEEVLDRLCSDDKMYWDGACVNYLVRKSAIEAERNKLKESK